MRISWTTKKRTRRTKKRTEKKEVPEDREDSAIVPRDYRGIPMVKRQDRDMAGNLIARPEQLVPEASEAVQAWEQTALASQKIGIEEDVWGFNMRVRVAYFKVTKLYRCVVEVGGAAFTGSGDSTVAALENCFIQLGGMQHQRASLAFEIALMQDAVQRRAAPPPDTRGQ